MDAKATIAIVVVLVIIVIVISVVAMQASKKHAAVLASCANLNIQTDQAGTPVLCPPNVDGRIWATNLGSEGIRDEAVCSADSSYTVCNRCVSRTQGVPAPYQADPLIGLAAGWPNSRYDANWPSYSGPVTDGQYVSNYQGDLAVADPAPVPLACLS